MGEKRIMLMATPSTFGGILHRIFDFMDFVLHRPAKSDFKYFLLLLRPHPLGVEFLREQGIPFRAVKEDPVEIYNAAKDWRIDLAHLHNLVGRGRFRRALRKAGIRVLVEQERGGSWARVPENCLRSVFTNHLVDGFCVNSLAGRAILQKRLFIDPSRVEVIYNGLNTKFLDAIPHRTIPEAQGKRIILTVCRLNTPKGLLSFVRSVPFVIREYPRAEFWLAGNGPLKEDLEKEVDHLGVKKHVRFWGAQKDVANFFRTAEVFVQVSNREPFPNALVEASYFGKPCIGTLVDGMPEVVENGVTGFLLPGKVPVIRPHRKCNRVARWVVDGEAGQLRKPLDVDPKELAEKICYLLQNKEKARQMGEKARKRVRNKFTMEKHVEAIERYYRELLT